MKFQVNCLRRSPGRGKLVGHIKACHEIDIFGSFKQVDARSEDNRRAHYLLNQHHTIIVKDNGY